MAWRRNEFGWFLFFWLTELTQANLWCSRLHFRN